MNDKIIDIRKSILYMMHYSKSSHIGSCFSTVEILYCLYYGILNIDPKDPKKKDRDVFILSKGHSSAALYTTLAHRGFFPIEWLEKYYTDGGLLPGHLDMDAVPGIECSAGSLGHGLPIGLGMAIARINQGIDARVYVLLGDGECNEGSVWEAIMLAGTRKVRNLFVIVDINHLQGMGRDVIDQTNLAERFTAFGWNAKEVNGHNIDELKIALSATSTRPTAIIAHTVKGQGVSFMQDRLEWHYKSPTDEEFVTANIELESSR
jgi:transketolase